ncbi:MAG: hypothetical protein H6711_05785 [Myxococcales bacterium]|nr:hypothetical protein [Myxococcales bacterium]
MKLTHITVVSMFTLALAACGGSSEPAASGDKAPAEGADKGDGAKEADAAPAVEVPKLTINEADWVEKDLKEVSPMINVTVKAPKDAAFEKNGNGGVDIKIAPHYMITVGALAVSSVKEGIEWGESSSIGNSSYKDGKKIVDEDAGFVFTYQMNDEDNGIKYAPESHWYFFVEKDGAIYSFHDDKPMDAFSTPPQAYTEDDAKKVYEIVKGSAKAN